MKNHEKAEQLRKWATWLGGGARPGWSSLQEVAAYLRAEADRLSTPVDESGLREEVDQAFHDLAIKERDYERVRNDRLAASLARAEQRATAWEKAARYAREQMGLLEGYEDYDGVDALFALASEAAQDSGEVR